MAKKTRCEICNRTFKDKEGLVNHNLAKHSKVEKEPSKKNYKKIRNWVIFFMVFILLIFWIFTSVSNSLKEDSQLNFTSPKGPIHWHPHLAIIINGVNQTIPGGIGLGGRDHSPIHTHDESGTLHMEESSPTKRSVILGYFFDIWGKKFNKECIFNYCTDKGELKMYVNGKENYDFQNYFMHDGDKIVIKYAFK